MGGWRDPGPLKWKAKSGGKEREPGLLEGVPRGYPHAIPAQGAQCAGFYPENSVGALPLHVRGSLGRSGEVPSEGRLVMSWVEVALHSWLDRWWTRAREHLA